MESNKMSKSKKLVRLVITILGVAALLTVFDLITNGVFVSPRNFTMLLKQSSVLMILASTLMMLLIEKNIDLSGGSGVYFTGTIMALLIVKCDWAIVPAILAGIALGVVMGSAEGFFIGYLQLPAFIVTLAFQQIYRGTGYVLTNAATVGPVPKAFINISEAFISAPVSIAIIVILYAIVLFNLIMKMRKEKGTQGADMTKSMKNIALVTVICAVLVWMFVGYRGLPLGVIIAFVVALVMYFISTKTVYGRHIYLIGGNIEAARLAGVHTEKRIFQSYIFEGLSYGIAGMVLCARLGGAASTAGQGLELDAVAAACIGGVSMSGGVGNIVGLTLGVIIMTSIDNVMSLMNVSSFLQMVAKGIILLISVCLDLYMNKQKYKFKLVKKGK